METTLVLTEKPSVAKDIASALDPSAKTQDGFILAKNGQMIITYAFGHLYQIENGIMPPTTAEDDLPFFPEKFKYETTSSGSKQARNIKNLLKGVQKVVIATDAGREGELIARLILIESGWSNWTNTYRFWTSEALSGEAVKKGFNNLKPALQYDNYYYSAISRQHGDFTMGLNLSRIASMKGGGRWSIGRVQTPVLKILCDRHLERDNFKPVEYYIIEALFVKAGFQFPGTLQLPEEEKLSKEKAQNIFERIQKENYATVRSVVKDYQKEPAPVLHSLTSLQREANKVFGYTAQQTLDIAQGLYEKYKVLSYPRTDSNYLSDNDQALASEILHKLGHQKLEENIQGNKIFNSKKLTDHHALVPLQDFLAEGKEGNVYGLVKKRFLTTFSSDFEYEKQKVITKVDNYDFVSTGKKILRPGWMVFYETKESLLPALKENETIGIEKIENLQKWTKAPGDFNDSSILKKMETLNLGTPATRAGILEKLIKIDYVKREKKALIATDKGLELIEKIGSSNVTSAELTQEWEEKLLKVSSRSDYEQFLGGIQGFTSSEVAKMKTLEISKKSSPKQIALARKLAKEKGLSLPEKLDDFQTCSDFITDAIKKPSLSRGNCGMCEQKGELHDIGKGVKCVSCERVVWKEVSGKKLTEKEILDLFSGKEVPLKGLKSKAGKKYAAAYQLKDKQAEFVKYINETKK